MLMHLVSNSRNILLLMGIHMVICMVDSAPPVKAKIFTKLGVFRDDAIFKEDVFSFMPSNKTIGLRAFTDDFNHEDDEYSAEYRFSMFVTHEWVPRKTFVIIHGYRDSAENEEVVEMKDAHLNIADVNVILIDWEQLAAGPIYNDTVGNVHAVAKVTAEIISVLVSKSSSIIDDFHFIGLNLGAHVAGVTGTYFRELTGLNLARITALDPARPLYDHAVLNERLDRSDADFVMVIHTDITFLGFTIPIGHADFLPNGGKFPQPACVGDHKSIGPVFCIHAKAVQYYIESVYHPLAFQGQQCESWQEFLIAQELNTTCVFNCTAFMSPNTETNARGMFFLKTADSPPFGQSYHLEGPLSLAPTGYTTNVTVNTTMVTNATATTMFRSETTIPNDTDNELWASVNYLIVEFSILGGIVTLSIVICIIWLYKVAKSTRTPFPADTKVACNRSNSMYVLCKTSECL